MAKLTTKKVNTKKSSAVKKQIKEVSSPTSKSIPITTEPKQKSGFWRTWTKIMFSPNEFFQQLPKEVKYKEPSFFAIKIQAIIFALFTLFLLLLGTVFIGLLGAMAPMMNGLGTAGMGILILFLLILLPFALFFGWIMLFVSAGIYHLFVLMFGGKEGYEETFKAITYSGAPVLFSIIPYVGFLSIFYIIYLEIIGIHHCQKLSIGKSAAVILIPLLIAIILIAMLMVTFLLPLIFA